MPSRYLLWCYCAAALVTTPISASSQIQADSGSRRLHDGMVAGIRVNAGTLALPQGDTFVVWRSHSEPGPILYSTVSRDGPVVASSLVRNDRMAGTTTAWWRGATEARVEVTWTRDDSTIQKVECVISRGEMRVSGSWDTVLAVPSGAWAVADYGMDDQVVPLVMRLVRDSSMHHVMLFRPYAHRWDTISVQAFGRPWGTLARLTTADGSVSTWWISRDGELIRIKSGDGSERTPVPMTRLFPKYHRIVRAERRNQTMRSVRPPVSALMTYDEMAGRTGVMPKPEAIR